MRPAGQLTAKDLGSTARLFGVAGTMLRVPESQIAVVAALSIDVTAYLFYVVEALTDAGILFGLSRGVAHDLMVQTVLAGATELRDSGQRAALLRESVTLPRSSTIAGLRQLEIYRVRAAFLAAVEASGDAVLNRESSLHV